MPKNVNSSPVSDVPGAALDFNWVKSEWARSEKYERLMTGFFLLAVAGLIALQPIWKEEKTFDDVAAISNAYHLKATGYAWDEMFFRSRLRPSFVFFVQPVCWVVPHELAEQRYDITDFHTRLYSLYTRHFGRRYLEITYYTVGAVVLVFLLSSLMYGRLGPGILFGAGCACALCLTFRRLLDEAAVTNAFTFATHLLTLTTFLWASRKPTWTRLGIAGLFCGWGILAKLDHSVAVTAVLILQLVAWAKAPTRRVFAQWSFYWLMAALPVLIWFEGFTDGALVEIPRFLEGQKSVQWMMGRPPATGRNYWNIFWEGFLGILPLAVMGMAVELTLTLRRKNDLAEADLFFAAYLAGNWGLLTLTFILPRFIVYTTIPFAYFACVFVWRIVRSMTPRKLSDSDARAAAGAVLFAVLFLAMRLPYPHLPDPFPSIEFHEDFSSGEMGEYFEKIGDENLSEFTTDGLMINYRKNATSGARRTLYWGERMGLLETAFELPEDLPGRIPFLRIRSRLDLVIVEGYVDEESISIKFKGEHVYTIPRSEQAPNDGIWRINIVTEPSLYTTLYVNEAKIASRQGVHSIAHIETGAFEPSPFDTPSPLIVREISMTPADWLKNNAEENADQDAASRR